MKKVVVVLCVILALVVLAVGGFVWYTQAHVFVDGDAYPKYQDPLDLREDAISLERYITVQSQLPDTTILWNVPFQGGLVSSDSPSLTVRSLTAEDVAMLAYFPDLTRLEVTDSQDYALLEKVQADYPQVLVQYLVDLGGESFSAGIEELSLNPGEYTFDMLMENLAHMTSLKTLHFPRTVLSAPEFEELTAAYGDISMDYTVELLGEEYAADTHSLDLSALTEADTAMAAQQLAGFTELKTVELMNSSGESGLSLEAVKSLKDAAPETAFHYVFDFYGTTVSTDDTEVSLKNVKIGDEGETQVRMLLDVMNGCDKLVLDNCKLSDEVMAQIREDYRDTTKVVWRVWFGKNGSSLTDAQVLRAVYHLVDDNCADLKYLEDVVYMDIGHNEHLDYPDFIAGMTKLEVCIISGSPIKSLDAFANCKSLRILEMANCLYAPDLTPLKECTSLEMLNIAHTKVESLAPLDELQLTHLCCKANPVPDEEIERFVELHPDCWTTSEGSVDYGVGWRYAEDNKALPWYEDISKVFHYPNAYNNVGWYLE